MNMRIATESIWRFFNTERSFDDTYFVNFPEDCVKGVQKWYNRKSVVFISIDIRRPPNKYERKNRPMVEKIRLHYYDMAFDQ